MDIYKIIGYIICTIILSFKFIRSKTLEDYVQVIAFSTFLIALNSF